MWEGGQLETGNGGGYDPGVRARKDPSSPLVHGRAEYWRTMLE